MSKNMVLMFLPGHRKLPDYREFLIIILLNPSNYDKIFDGVELKSPTPFFVAYSLSIRM
jgi:hypothetical protein